MRNTDLRELVHKAWRGVQLLDIMHGDETVLHNALHDLSSALGDSEKVLAHIMDVDVFDDDFLFQLYQRLGGYIIDAAKTDALVDSARIQLTASCESVLEALSAAPVEIEEVPPPEDDEEALPEIQHDFEAKLAKFETVLAKTVSVLLFVLKYAIKRDSLPSASRHAKELEAEARKAGIRGWA
jgi:hypothetical protein